MKSRWNDDDAARYVKAALASGHGEELRLRIYSSRIIGGDPGFVLHGGGNTSVKVKAYDGEELMHIKGSGWDLDSIEAPGLPAVRLAPLLAARIKGERLPDPDMVALLRANLMEQDAPQSFRRSSPARFPAVRLCRSQPRHGNSSPGRPDHWRSVPWQSHHR